ncbi:MAG: 3-deoxy-D-manno-octulosonic acid transferase [Marinirhabdus sp.]
MELFVKGRAQTFNILHKAIAPGDATLWFHCASLGEYEQAVPIVQACKKQYPAFKIVVTFFSPSGYENKKNGALADVVCYLPWDTQTNAKKFIAAVRPTLAFFIKYEIWPNYFFQLKASRIPALLVSGVFRKEQVFFKRYGGFMEQVLKTLTHIFVQDGTSAELLKNMGITDVTVSGDTRFDRVSQQIEMDNTLPFVKNFKQDSLCIVCGSTWPEDEAVLLDYINEAPKTIKFIIAPHKINALKIGAFQQKLKKTSVKHSTMNEADLAEKDVLIIDTIGLLTKIYSYADIAYVGGAMGGTGLHNILEAATFGIPVVIGKNYGGFPEAQRLRSLAGLYSVASPTECSRILTTLVAKKTFRSKTGMIAGHFVNSNTGATQKVMDYVTQSLKDGPADENPR